MICALAHPVDLVQILLYLTKLDSEPPQGANTSPLLQAAAQRVLRITPVSNYAGLKFDSMFKSDKLFIDSCVILLGLTK